MKRLVASIGTVGLAHQRAVQRLGEQNALIQHLGGAAHVVAIVGDGDVVALQLLLAAFQ